MGRIINVSQPTVLNTQLAPLSDSLFLELSGSKLTEQWYYENDGVFLPNREVSPLIIIPKPSAIDSETHQEYLNPTIAAVRWYVLEWKGNPQGWVETQVETTVQSSEFYLSGTNLVVRKNMSDASHGITIRCVVSYQDPRDISLLHEIEEKLLLTTNLDATVLYPKINIENETTRVFDPLRDYDPVTKQGSTFEFQASSDWSQVTEIGTDVMEYKVDPLGTEAIVPSNDEDVETCAPKMDIRYGDHPVREDEQFMFRQVADGDYAGEPIDKAYIERMKGNAVVWNQLVKIPSVESQTKDGITITNNNDGSITFDGTASADGYFGISMSSIPNISHKYYITAIKGSSRSTYYASYGNMNDTVLENIIAPRAYGTTVGCSFMYKNGASINNVRFYPLIIDLTLMFGAGSEPSTVEEFEAWLATNVGLKGYYPYNAGSLIPVKTSAIKTVGFNQWDEEWEVGNLNSNGVPIEGMGSIRSKNYIQSLGNETYKFYCSSVSVSQFVVYFYDANKNMIPYTGEGAYQNGYNGSSGLFTTPSGTAFMRFRGTNTYGPTYNNDICINISDATRNGTYEAYREDKTSLPITTLKGKLNGSGSSVTIFPDGMKSAGSVYDEIKVDGGQLKAIKRLGSRDYESGDESDTSVITDRTTTYYSLATPQEYVLDPLPRGVFVWFGIKNDQEVLIDTLDEYKMAIQPFNGGQYTDKININALYANDITVVLRLKRFSGDNDTTDLLPMKEYRSIAWKLHPIDAIVFSHNGDTVKVDSNDFKFSTIVNMNGRTLSDDVIRENLRFKWKTREGHLSTEENKGYATEIILDKSEVWSTTVQGGQTKMSTCNVSNEVYLLDAYEQVLINGENVTFNGENVFVRKLNEI